MKKVKVTCKTQKDVDLSGQVVNQSLPLADFDLYIQNGLEFDDQGLNEIKDRIREFAMIVTPGGAGVDTVLEIQEE